ncbi:MAG: hypothetical protein ACI8QZ_002466 [Chlamydiales bacterium]|jgi:hypothetical protein
MPETPILDRLVRTLGLVVLPLAQGGSDPFNPDLRWVFPAPATDQWIPSDVTFAGSENLVWVSSVGTEGRWSVLDAPGESPAGARTPHFQGSAPASSATSVMAVAGQGADALYGMRQEVVSGNDRLSEVFRHDALKAGGAATMDPVWTFTSGVVSRGSALVATDHGGQLVAFAVLDPDLARIELNWIDGPSGALIQQRFVPGSALNELQVSANGKRVVLAAGLDVFVFNGRGAQIDQLARTAATPALALSSTGRVLAVGGSSRLDVWVQGPGSYRIVRTLLGSPVELATRAALSANGSLLALTWWDRTTGVGLRLETWDLAPGTRLINYSQNGLVGGPQNVAQALHMTPDGRRVALGTWGLGGAEPEVLLFDLDDPSPVFSADLPGSVHALALDSTGTRIAVAHKDAHANQFSSTGGVRFFDTGERALQQQDVPVLGGQVQLVAARPGAGSVLFLIGERAPQPIHIPGVGGAALLLQRSSLLVYPRSADSSGRAQWSANIPDDPAWIGVPWSAQAAFRVDGSTELSGVVIDPLVLAP